ncbi:sigma factor [Nonomuraea sp. NPDC049695]|uniref:sigma factor n=1 Tax=Nonomuraea sp. NPDC049695 TaxID=3154734 RepID=UPI0034398113
MSDPTEDAAYAAFVEAAWSRHMAVAVLLTGDRHRAEELLQDCLVRLYVQWRRVGSADPHAYLRRMLVNGNVSGWRRRQREQPRRTTFSPGTRAALFRLLAGQPAIKSIGDVTDSLGRPGTALALTTADRGDGAGESRLVVDRGTAELLCYEFRPQGKSEPALRVTYEDMGWVDGLGERPDGN